MLVANAAIFALVVSIGEVALRLFWNPVYWVRCEGWVFGSGHSEAGKKWSPGATYEVRSREFRTRFRVDALGYRARREPPRTADPYRVAFVGDSFTEAIQVADDETFVARIERGLAASGPGREVVCENFGVSATGPFDYWHRIVHDVFRPGAAPPEALVLCLFPGNDFTVEFPADGFEPDGTPRRRYFREAGWGWDVVTWLNLKSKLAHFVLRSVRVASLRGARPPRQGPWLWWADPAIAASAPDAPAIRRCRALMRAIEAECRRHGTRLVVLVVGPSEIYVPRDGGSPLARILSDWGVEAPVIDAAAAAAALPDRDALVFPRDRHPNPAGHRFIATVALEPLRAALDLPVAGTALAR